jgi:3-isopropylmalate/(R)-2-methylmalate dehydratase small subunit
VSTSFADIFRNNSLKNGLLPIIVDRHTHSELLALEPGAEVHIDLASQTLRLPTGRAASFPVDSFSKYCLLTGVDQLGYLIQKAGSIEAYEQAHPARVQTYIRD